MMTDQHPELHLGAANLDDEADLIALTLQGMPTHQVQLDPADFLEPKHETIWRASTEVGPDLTAIRIHLNAGPEATNDLLDLYARNWVLPGNAQTLADRIRDNANRRRVRATAIRLLQQADSDLDVTSLIEAGRHQLGAIADTQPTTTATPPDLLPTVFAQLESGTPRGLSLPWPDLNEPLQGLQPGRLYVIGARPGVGKSMLGQNTAEHFAETHKQTVAYFSLEMSANEVMLRMLAHQSGVDSTKLQAGAKRILTQDWEKLAMANTTLLEMPIHIVDAATQTTGDINAHCQRIRQTHGLGLVVVDYLQLITPRDRAVNREQQVADATRQLKILAKELDVPVLLLSQLRRPEPGQASKRPGLTDLRESGAIEQDADVVIILHQPDPDNEPWALDAHVAKNRSGQLGMAQLLLAGHVASIRSSLRGVA